MARRLLSSRQPHRIGPVLADGDVRELMVCGWLSALQKTVSLRLRHSLRPLGQGGGGAGLGRFCLVGQRLQEHRRPALRILQDWSFNIKSVKITRLLG
jgi:hypothetical protein